MKKLSKEERQEIKKLVKEKNYDQIYLKYGQETYLWYLPDRVRKQNIKKLLKERRFLDIYNKFGEDEYKKYLPAMKKMDKYYELTFKETSMVPVHKNNIIRKIKNSVSLFLAGTVAVPGVAIVGSEYIKNESLGENSQLVEEYINDLKIYSEKFKQEIKNNNLSEIDIYMKLMDDMWKDIDGYKHAENEMKGCLGATLKQEKVGVCRNFADDISKKLNLINPNYNARSFFLHIDGTGANIEFANIEKNIIQTNETTLDEEKKQDDAEIKKDKNVNNHAVVALDTEFEGKKVTLFLDPTNPMIGVYQNGEIKFFNSDKDIANIGNNFDKIVVEGKDYIKNFISYSKSFNRINEEDYEKLESIYGVEAQNSSLEKIRSLEKKDFKENLEDMTNNIKKSNIEVNENEYEVEFAKNTKEDIEKYIQNSDLER